MVIVFWPLTYFVKACLGIPSVIGYVVATVFQHPKGHHYKKTRISLDICKPTNNKKRNYHKMPSY